MKQIKILTTIVYICVAGVLASFAGSIYTGIQIHREKNKPQPTVFPTPAMRGESTGAAAPAAPAPQTGALPTPAR